MDPDEWGSKTNHERYTTSYNLGLEKDVKYGYITFQPLHSSLWYNLYESQDVTL